MNIKKFLVPLVVAALLITAGTAFAFSRSAQAIEGTVDDVTPTTIVVDGKTIRIDGNTVLEVPLIPGVEVEVKARFQSDGSLLALKIEAENEDKFELKVEGDLVKLEGKIDSMTSNSIVIAGKTILTDNNTKIEGTLAPGLAVEVVAKRQADGSLLALKIELEDEDEVEIEIEGDLVKLEGKLESMTSNSVVVAGKTILIDNNTEIEGTLVPGLAVEVKAKRQADGSLLALKIELEDEEEGRVRLEGKIESLSSNSIVIAGKTFLTDNNTRIDGALAVGATARVRAVTQSDGSLLATRIQLREDHRGPGHGEEADDEGRHGHSGPSRGHTED
ncbi:MAG: hypothetical protein HY665_01240 [Chloroflexi bacterium]|nr:hypothetical protein [Chloroflexota bacterium]